MKTIQFVTKALASLSCLAVLCTFMPALSQAAADEVTLKGPIVSRDGETMTVRCERGDIKITLTEDTKVSVTKGLIGVRTEQMSMAALIPGLRVEVKADFAADKYTAKSVKFSPDDLKAANDMQAALSVPQQQLKESQEKIKAQEKELEQRKAEDAALAKRFSDLTEYDLKDEATVLFAVNSAKLSEKAKKDLKALAAKAKDIKGYMIQVVGYADASGKAEFNQALSDRRAEAVTQYLRKSCGVGISRVLAPAALGTAKPAASNETAKGKAENRRVTVKVIVNRGMAQ